MKKFGFDFTSSGLESLCSCLHIFDHVALGTNCANRASKFFNGILLAKTIWVC